MYLSKIIRLVKIRNNDVFNLSYRRNERKAEEWEEGRKGREREKH